MNFNEAQKIFFSFLTFTLTSHLCFYSGALVRGSRVNLSSADIRSPRARVEQNNEVNVDSNSQLALVESKNDENKVEENQEVSSYQAIEAAYRQRGIRIRLSPGKGSPSQGSAAGRRSALSLRRPSTFSNRNPSRTSSVLNYSSTKPEFEPVERSFSVLQQASSNAFESEHTKSLAFTQSTEISEVPTVSGFSENETSPKLVTSAVTTEKSVIPINLSMNDPDLAYMSVLLKTSAGESYRGIVLLLLFIQFITIILLL